MAHPRRRRYVMLWRWKAIEGRVQLTEETCTIGELISKVTTSFSQDYRFHRYAKTRQPASYRKKLGALLQGEVLVVLDFAENYSFLLQDEVTSHYYARAQCSLLTIAAYYRSSSGEMEHFTNCGITDDFAARCCTGAIWHTVDPPRSIKEDSGRTRALL